MEEESPLIPKCPYLFRALDARHDGEFSGGNVRTEARIRILYNPVLPRKNKPFTAFISYRFQLPEASS
jgi:hypothetical protein